MIRPKFSICIPFFNTDESYLMECLDSVFNQDWSDYEVIIVDDGSDVIHKQMLQNTLDKVNDSRVRVVWAYHSGLYETRIKAMHAAKGSYLISMDSDDRFLLSDALKTLNATCIKFSNPDVILYNASPNPSGMPKLVDYSVFRSSNEGIAFSLDIHSFLDTFAIDYQYNNFFLKCFKRDFIQNFTVKADGLVMCEDRLLTSQLLFNASNVVVLDLALHYYRQHSSSFVHKEFSINSFYQRALVEKYVQQILTTVGVVFHKASAARLKWIVGDFGAIRRTIKSYKRRVELYSDIVQSSFFNDSFDSYRFDSGHIESYSIALFAKKRYWFFLDLSLHLFNIIRFFSKKISRNI